MTSRLIDECYLQYFQIFQGDKKKKNRGCLKNGWHCDSDADVCWWNTWDKHNLRINICNYYTQVDFINSLCTKAIHHLLYIHIAVKNKIQRSCRLSVRLFKTHNTALRLHRLRSLTCGPAPQHRSNPARFLLRQVPQKKQRDPFKHFFWFNSSR